MGNGWLGKALKDYWLKEFPDLLIYSFNRSPQIEAITYNLGSQTTTPGELDDCQVLYILIPPGKDGDLYINSLYRLTKVFDSSKQVIFMSTTSVFNADQGHCNEDTTPLPQESRAKLLLKAEQIILTNFPKSTIIRSGGQIGPDRYPVRSMVKRESLPNGNVRVNIIHQEDLVKILSLPLIMEVPRIIHAVSPFHPLKSDFYSQQAKSLEIEIGLFPEGVEKEKVIDSQFLKDIDYQFERKNCEV